VLRNLFFGSSEILWIDSTGDFSADRALEVLHTISEEQHPSKPSMDLDSDSNPFEPSPPSIENALEDALTRLRVSVAFDIQTAYEIFDSLGLSTNSAVNNASHHFSETSTDPAAQTMFTSIRCIVIDPITPLLSPHLSAASAQGHALMTAFMRHLKALAIRFNLVVFVSVYAFSTPIL